MTVRLVIAAVSVLGIYFGAESLKGGGMPTELAQPQLELSEMPRTMQSWTGEDTTPLDEDIVRAIGAAKVINRRYQNGRTVVELHSDVFLRYGVRILHPPELCYSSNGFAINNSETINIAPDDKSSQPAQLLTLEHDGARVYCLYWYQIGATTFWNGDGQRRAVLSLRGKVTWTPLIKVMLQTTADSSEQAQQKLKPLATLVYQWTKDYH